MKRENTVCGRMEQEVTVNRVFRAESYILRHDRLLWIVPVLYCAVGVYAGFYDHAVMDIYEGLELFSLPEIMNIFFPFSAAAVTGYVIGGDFSRRTIQNVLSVGTDKKHYYYSRLLVQGVVTGALFTVTGLIHVVCHWFWPQGNSDIRIEFLWQKLLVYMTVALLQLLASVSVINAVCYFVKNQLVTIGFGIGLVYLELIIYQAAEINGMGAVQALADFFPTNVLRNIFAYAVYDRVFTGEFFQYGLSAILVIAVSSAAGYVRFCYDRD